MRAAIMQPYIFPYIGYFQLIKASDIFVLYDNIQFTKKGWINRNRILVNGEPEYISFPLKKDSDFLNVDQRYLAESFVTDKVKMLRKIENAYRKAPHFQGVTPIVRDILDYPETNLFKYIFHSLKIICEYLGIQTEIIASSNVNADHDLKGKSRVLAICEALHADEYLNPIGGTELYDKEEFIKTGVTLGFVKPAEIQYPQFGKEQVPYLSIIDVMMFNSKDQINNLLNSYTII